MDFMNLVHRDVRQLLTGEVKGNPQMLPGMAVGIIGSTMVVLDVCVEDDGIIPSYELYLKGPDEEWHSMVYLDLYGSEYAPEVDWASKDWELLLEKDMRKKLEMAIVALHLDTGRLAWLTLEEAQAMKQRMTQSALRRAS